MVGLKKKKKTCSWIKVHLPYNLAGVSWLPFTKFLHPCIHFLPSFVTKLSFSFFSSRATAFVLGALHPWSSFHYFPLLFLLSSASFSSCSPEPRRNTGIPPGTPTHPKMCRYHSAASEAASAHCQLTDDSPGCKMRPHRPSWKSHSVPQRMAN